MGYQIATIVLNDGRRFNNVTIVGGTASSAPDAEALQFTDEDIAEIVVTHGRLSPASSSEKSPVGGGNRAAMPNVDLGWGDSVKISGKFPHSRIPVSSPEDLVSVLRVLREFVAAGSLRQFAPLGEPVADTVFSDILDDGPWPDLLTMHFKGNDGTRYRLAVETFHGAGGEWTPLVD